MIVVGDDKDMSLLCYDLQISIAFKEGRLSMETMKLSLKMSLCQIHLSYYLASLPKHPKNHTFECQPEITEKQALKGVSRS